MQPFNYLRLVFLLGVLPSLVVLWMIPDLIPLHHDLAGMVNEAGFTIREPQIVSKYGSPLIPMEQFFYGLPVYLSTWINIPVYQGIVLQCFLVLQLGALLTCWIIYKGGLSKSRVQTLIWIAGIYGINFLLPLAYRSRNIFGLREHLFVALILPFLMLLCARLSGFHPGRLLAAMVGIVAGLAIIFKPVYVLLFLFVETVFLVYNRRLFAFARIETLFIVLVGSGYLFYWFFYTEYFIRIKNLISAVQGYLVPQLALIATEFFYLAPAIVLLVHILFRRKAITQQDNTAIQKTVILFSACISSALVLQLQQRGYSHHSFPIAVFVIVFALSIWHVLSKKILTIFLIFCTYSILHEVNLKFQLIGNQAGRSIGTIIQNKTVAAISPHLRPFHTAILKNGAKWQFPVRNMAYLATEYKRFDVPDSDFNYIPIESFSESGRFIHQQVIGMLEDYPPDFIIVDTSTQWPLKYIQVNYLEALKMDEKFQLIWRNYQLLHASCVQEGIVCYEVYAYKKELVSN